MDSSPSGCQLSVVAVARQRKHLAICAPLPSSGVVGRVKRSTAQHTSTQAAVLNVSHIAEHAEAATDTKPLSY